MSPVQTAWESLSNSLRLYVESSLKFKTLVCVDREEAIANHDRAFDAKMEAFHRFYDLTKTLDGFDYFAHGDTSLFIVLRNALHHRDHDLFMSWNMMAMQDGGSKNKAGAAFLLGNYGGPSYTTSKYFLPLHDFYARLEHNQVKNSTALRVMWDGELSFAALAQQGQDERYPDAHVYVNVIPVFLSAMRRTASWLRSAAIEPAGYDGKTYASHFSGMEAVDLSRLVFDTVRFPHGDAVMLGRAR